MGGFVPDVHDLSTTGPRAWVSAGWWIARAGWRTSQSPWTPPCPVSTRVIEARVVAIDLGGLGSRCGYPPIRATCDFSFAECGEDRRISLRTSGSRRLLGKSRGTFRGHIQGLAGCLALPNRIATTPISRAYFARRFSLFHRTTTASIKEHASVLSLTVPFVAKVRAWAELGGVSDHWLALSGDRRTHRTRTHTRAHQPTHALTHSRTHPRTHDPRIKLCTRAVCSLVHRVRGDPRCLSGRGLPAAGVLCQSAGNWDAGRGGGGGGGQHGRGGGG